MSSFPQFIYSMQDENAKTAMENYVQILQQAFEHYRNLWEDYVKLQKKYEQNNIHSSFQIDEPCIKTKELTPQRDVNGRAYVQESDTIPLLKLDRLNMNNPDCNPDIRTSSLHSSESPFRNNDSNLSKSPVFFRSRLRTSGTSVKKSLQFSKTMEHNKVMPDTRIHNIVETLFSKCNKKEISTAHHVETIFLPDGKRLKQSQLVFHPIKRDKEKVSSPNVKLVDTSLRTKQDSVKEISAAKASITVDSNALNAETLEDVIEISPTQRNVKSNVKHRLRLKRKTSVKQMKENSPDKNRCHNAAPAIIIEDTDFESPLEYISGMEDDGSVTAGSTAMKNTTLKNKLNMSNSSPVKIFNKTSMQITETIESQKEKQPVLSKAENMLSVNDPAYEDETFYLPAEQAANRNDVDDFIENQPPAKKMLVNKFNAKRKEVPEQLNMRCKADRAKLNGWDCWECKKYYENLPLSKEELQIRKNQCSRHRHKYERPRTPEGFWDLDSPDNDTMSSTLIK